jgi:TonB family protein
MHLFPAPGGRAAPLMPTAAIRAMHREASSGLPIAIASSVLIHVALLAASPMLRLGSTAPSAILRVSLLASPGSRGDGGVAGTVPAPAAALADHVESQAPRPHAVAKKSVPARSKPLPAPPRAAPVSSRQAKEVSSSPPAGTTRQENDGSGSPSAAGNGSSDAGSNASRDGDGAGSGGGSGGGVGDLRLACEYCPTPRYPRTAVARKVEGVVQVGFTLTSDGRVGEVEVRSSSGDHELDRAAVDVARRSRFRLPVPLADAAPGHGYLEYQFQLARRGNT